MTDEPGPLLASGRAADVYDLGDGTVLRRYRPRSGAADGEGDSPDAGYEADVMRHVAAHGYPVPAVHGVDGADLVMDRVDGPTMMQAVSAAPWKLLWHARVLARLQRRLAAIPAPEWMLAATADPDHAESILHLDLHPMNVIISPRHGPVVIDWTNAAGGPAAFDAALTYVEIATYEVTSPQDRTARRVFGEAFRRFRRAPHFDAYVVAACDHRLADRGTTPGERVAVAALRTKHSG